MTTQFVTEYIYSKLSQNEDYIRYTFYELRVKNNLTEEETNNFLDLNKNYFENKGYKVYFTGQSFKYNDTLITVEPNVLMVAVKEVGKDEKDRGKVQK